MYILSYTRNKLYLLFSIHTSNFQIIRVVKLMKKYLPDIKEAVLFSGIFFEK